jgi:hypothetical protein
MTANDTVEPRRQENGSTKETRKGEEREERGERECNVTSVEDRLLSTYSQ